LLRREGLEHALAILRSHHADAIELLDREGNGDLRCMSRA
jgi:hypothetical protein